VAVEVHEHRVVVGRDARCDGHGGFGRALYQDLPTHGELEEAFLSTLSGCLLDATEVQVPRPP
jgi:predicted GNAT superfamily acetyltransferase